MGHLTHVLWSILDEELDSHGYFTIWLNLSEKMRKSIQGQVRHETVSKFHVDTVINEEVIPEKPRGGRIRPPRRWRVNKATSTYSLYISDFLYIYDLGSGQAPDLSIMSQWGKYWHPSQRISKV